MIYAFLLSLLLQGAGGSKLTIAFDGRVRSFVLYQPEGMQAGEPLVIALHGRLGTGEGMERLTHFERIAAREKFLLIYPDGVRKSWNDGRETPAEKEGVDDVGFIRALIDSAIRNCHVDPKRVYVTGISNGGFMTMRLATALADRIAAVAVVAATMDAGTADAGTADAGTMDAGTMDAGTAANGSGVGTYLARRPISVLLIHGTKDPLVPIAGGSVHGGAGGPILSHDSTVNWWVKLDACQAEPARTKQVPDSAGDGTTAMVKEYKGGALGTEVVSYIIHNGGHTWPGGWQYLPVMMVGRTSRNLDASEIIWDFFERNPKQ